MQNLRLLLLLYGSALEWRRVSANELHATKRNTPPNERGISGNGYYNGYLPSDAVPPLVPSFSRALSLFLAYPARSLLTCSALALLLPFSPSLSLSLSLSVFLSLSPSLFSLQGLGAHHLVALGILVLGDV